MGQIDDDEHKEEVVAGDVSSSRRVGHFRLPCRM